MKMFNWLVQFSVAKTWVADGFAMTDTRALDMINATLPYSGMGECLASVIAGPSVPVILGAQGYGPKHPDYMGELKALALDLPPMYCGGVDVDALVCLAIEVQTLNPAVEEIGAGKLAHMIELARKGLHPARVDE